MMNTTFEKYMIPKEDLDSILQSSNYYEISYATLSNENLLYEIATQKGITIDKKMIQEWRLYENEEKDLTQNVFFEFFLSDLPKNSSVLLFTDEGLLKKVAFQFEVNEFVSFSDMYEEYFGMEFFQFSYYCILSFHKNICRFIDEAGSIHEVELSKFTR